MIALQLQFAHYSKDNNNCVEIQDDGPGFPERIKKESVNCI